MQKKWKLDVNCQIVHENCEVNQEKYLLNEDYVDWKILQKKQTDEELLSKTCAQ